MGDCDFVYLENDLSEGDEVSQNSENGNSEKYLSSSFDFRKGSILYFPMMSDVSQGLDS
jgi:hypothetical protein